MILHLVQRPVTDDGTGTAPTSSSHTGPQVLTRDVYDLDGLDLSGTRGIMVSGGCDQRFLRGRRALLDDFVSAGGRLLINGHPLEPFVSGLPAHRKLEFHTTRDLWLSETGSHPIWDGIDRRDLLLNTGVPGRHTFEELTRIGVAGFYAHAYLVDLPQDAVAITGIGQAALPVDVSYPLGNGEVIIHLGNDLMGFSRPGTSAHDLSHRVLRHLEEGR
jgi:hypothetical protein